MATSLVDNAQRLENVTVDEVESEDEDDGARHEDAIDVEKAPKKRGRKKKLPGEKVDFKEDWFPNWWVAFVEHGPLSNNPIVSWGLAKLSGGPIDYSIEAIEIKSRKKSKKEKRDDIRFSNSLLVGGLVTPSNKPPSSSASSAPNEALAQEMFDRTDKVHKEIARCNNIQLLNLRLSTVAWLPESEQANAREKILREMDLLSSGSP